MEKKTFQIGMAKMIAAFGVEVQPVRSEVYWEALGDLPGDLFIVACKRALAEWITPFAFPPIAVLLRFANDAAAQSGAIIDGDSAWAYLMRNTVRRFRPGVADQIVDWPDPLSRQVIRDQLGTIYNLATLEGEYAIDQARRRFVKAYDSQRATLAAQPTAADAPALPARPAMRLVSGENS